MRLVHPLNSFLVPKNNLVEYNGKRLGEEPALINFVNEYLKENFPLEMEELENITMAYEFPVGSTVNNINWNSVEQNYKSIDKEAKNQIDFKEDTLEITEKINQELNEETASYNLLKNLRSIGMAAFKYGLYPALKSNPNATIQDVISYYSEYSTYSLNSQKSRLSSSKTIFKNDLEEEALNIIANSNTY